MDFDIYRPSRAFEPISIVLCGLVRRPDLFLRLLSNLNELITDGLIDKVIYSTWSGEIQRYPNVQEYFRHTDAILLETQEPSSPAGTGSIYFQKLVFYQALRLIPDDRLVLRLRPDTLLPHRLNLRNLILYLSEAIGSSAAHLCGLRHKVWTGLFRPTHPLWLEDRYFAGRASDLSLLNTQGAGSQLSLNSHRGAAIAEAQWFAAPFFDHFELIRDAMRVNWHTSTIPGSLSKGGLFRDLIKHQPDILRIIAGYHSLLERGFLIGLPESVFRFDSFIPVREPNPLSATALYDIIEQYCQRSPTYADYIHSFRQDEQLLNRPLLDEASLEDDLLKAGTLLYPRTALKTRLDRQSGFTPDDISYYQNIRFGISYHSNNVLARGSTWATVSWLNDNEILSSLSGRKMYLNYCWTNKSGDVIQAPWHPLNWMNKRGHEEDFPIHAPAKPGSYQVIFRIGGEGIGWNTNAVERTFQVVR